MCLPGTALNGVVCWNRIMKAYGSKRFKRMFYRASVGSSAAGLNSDQNIVSKEIKLLLCVISFYFYFLLGKE